VLGKKLIFEKNALRVRWGGLAVEVAHVPRRGGREGGLARVKKGVPFEKGGA